MIVGILGHGEIGEAIERICKEAGETVLIKDLEKNEFEDKIEVLHVCIPYDEDIINLINKLVEEHNIDLVIIHSTVKVGTTRKVKNAVHSPVRGVHPNLYEGIKTFVKYIGSDDPKLTDLTEELFDRYGLVYKSFESSNTTELNKLLDTTYYGICIEAHRYFKETCDHFGVDFDTIKDFNQTYNEGYKKLGKENVIRPVLDPPVGSIGGHCILSNINLLNEQFDTGFLKSIFKEQVD